MKTVTLFLFYFYFGAFAQTYDGKNVLPDTDLAYDVGSLTYRWKGMEAFSALVDNVIADDGEIYDLSVDMVEPLTLGGNIIVEDKLRPQDDDVVDLGSNTSPWNTLYTDDIYWGIEMVPRSSGADVANSTHPVGEIRCKNLTLTGEQLRKSTYYSFVGYTPSNNAGLFPSGTTTTVNYTTIVQDNSSSWDASSAKYTAKVKGAYSVTMYASWLYTLSTGGNRIITIEKNGTPLVKQTIRSEMANTYPMTVTVVVDLDVDDEIETTAYQNQPNDLYMTSDLNIHLLSRIS
jgi:hypothetical protein